MMVVYAWDSSYGSRWMQRVRAGGSGCSGGGAMDVVQHVRHIANQRAGGPLRTHMHVRVSVLCVGRATVNALRTHMATEMQVRGACIGAAGAVCTQMHKVTVMHDVLPIRAVLEVGVLARMQEAIVMIGVAVWHSAVRPVGAVVRQRHLLRYASLQRWDIVLAWQLRMRQDLRSTSLPGADKWLPSCC